MTITCKLGFHKWTGGKCSACGKTKNDAVSLQTSAPVKAKAVSSGAPALQPAPAATTTAVAPATSGDGWYYATTADEAVRQMVLSFPAGSVQDTEFGTLILPADKFPMLAQHSWCAGFCQINGQSLLVMRAGEFASDVKQAGVTAAISFCHMPSHPLLLVSIRVDKSDLGSKVGPKYPQAGSLACPVSEWVCGLNPFDRELVPAVLGTEPFRLLVCEDGGGHNTIFMPDGSVVESSMPLALCEFKISLPSEAKKLFNDEWKQLLSHDSRIPAGRRNFQVAGGPEILKYLPMDNYPILPKN